MKRFLFLIGFSVASLHAFSQATNCAQTLRLAQSVYDQGRLYELEDIISKGLMVGDCDKQTKVSLYKLLTLAYIYLEEPQKADDSMLKLLQTDHYFEINESVDPAEFVALYKTFRSREIYRIGAKLGVSATQPNVINSITAVELAVDSEYKYGIALHFGGAVDVPLNNRMTLHGELLYFSKKFELDLKVDRGFDINGAPLTQEFQGFETQNWLSLPLSFEYTFAEKKYNPYVAGGFSVDYLLNAKMRSERTRASAAAIPETSFDFNPMRKNINLSALLATGVKLKISGGYFIAEVRYLYGLTKLNGDETAFESQQAVWDQGYADPVFKLTSLALSGSYVLNIFNPRKNKIKSSR
ncbi:MAG: PorT family protein [Cyclobacteriaceae bacterium]|nr:PorT family protein [Cyclobacteriaceae bacterium]